MGQSDHELLEQRRDRLVLVAAQQRQALSEDLDRLTPPVRLADRAWHFWRMIRSPLLALPTALAARLLWRKWKKHKYEASHSKDSQEAHDQGPAKSPLHLFRHGIPVVQGVLSLWQHWKKSGNKD